MHIRTLQMRTHFHLLFVFSLSRLAPLFLGGVEGFEVGTLVVVESLRVLMNDVRCNLVQERPVVRYDQHSARIVLEVVCQECDRRNVQHVRRFVKKQQIRFAEKSTCKCQSHPPTTRERLCGKLLPLGGES